MRSIRLIGAAALLMTCGLAPPAWAQFVRVQFRPVQARKTPKGIPGPAVQRLLNMTPEEREKALARLPPERRAQIEQRLNRLAQLPPEQRAELQQRYQEFQSLPKDRQEAVRLELQSLRALPPRLRQRRLNSPGFQREYSPEEQRLLRQSMGLPAVRQGDGN
jgi:hypothetical protein